MVIKKTLPHYYCNKSFAVFTINFTLKIKNEIIYSMSNIVHTTILITKNNRILFNLKI